MINLEGIFPPIPTSFHVNEELNPEMIRENIENLMRHELSGVLVLGSNGELVMLEEKEKEEVYATAKEAIPYGKLFIAGCGGQSTRETVRLTRLASKHGADAALVLNPYYYKGQMTSDVLVKHYHSVADESPIPVIVYNMPANSGIDMDADILVRMADHSNIIGLKDSGGDMEKMSRVIRETGDDFQTLAGSANFFFPALEAGAAGGILALANIRPQKCLELRNAFLQGKLKEAVKIQKSIVALNTFVTRQWGIPALKAAMDSIGMYGGPARMPLNPLEESRRLELFALLNKLD